MKPAMNREVPRLPIDVRRTGPDGTVNRRSFSRFFFLANETADEHLIPSGP
jgi:hypothetical protein